MDQLDLAKGPHRLLRGIPLRVFEPTKYAVLKYVPDE